MPFVCGVAVCKVIATNIDQVAHVLIENVGKARWLISSAPATSRELPLFGDVGIEVPQDEREDIATNWSRPANVVQNTMSSRDSQIRVEVKVRDHEGAQRRLSKKLYSTTLDQRPDNHCTEVVLEQELAANRDSNPASRVVDRVNYIVDTRWNLMLELMVVMLRSMGLLHDKDVRLVSELLDDLPPPPNDRSCSMVAAEEGHGVPGDQPYWHLEKGNSNGSNAVPPMRPHRARP